MTLVSAGRVGRPHGRDGSFWVEAASHALPAGLEVLIGDRAHRVVRRAGSDDRPLVRLAALEDPRAVRGQPLLVHDELAAGEFVVADLVGCRVGDYGEVRRVVEGPSCSLLELDTGALVPLVSDAVRAVDLEARLIEVDPGFVA